MDERLLEQIDQRIEASRSALMQSIKKLIAIKSVKGEPMPGAPFGNGPRAILDAVMEMGKAEGFYTTDYHVGVVSLALKEGEPDLGIWLHGDVVPEGKGWLWPPFDATEYQGCIIGRGATDNKGQLCAIYYLLKIFKELGIQLRYNPALYVGSDEESGMHDMSGVPGNEDAKGFCNVCTPPRLSLVPDGSFPVGYGGKGSLKIRFSSKNPLNGLKITAGQPETPGKAIAHLYGKAIITHSLPRHGSKPDPNGNMITKLMTILLDENLAADENRSVLEFFKLLSLDTNGKQFGIDVVSEIMTPVVITTQRIDMEDGRATLTASVNYPIEITSEEIIRNIKSEAEKNGVVIKHVEQLREPYLLDENWSVITQLNDIANEITEQDKEPYTVGGGTYAHKLPNALVYGMNGCKKPEGFPEGHGGAHGLDELVSLDRLLRAMRIYARALLALNEMEW